MSLMLLEIWENALRLQINDGTVRYDTQSKDRCGYRFDSKIKGRLVAIDSKVPWLRVNQKFLKYCGISKSALLGTRNDDLSEATSDICQKLSVIFGLGLSYRWTSNGEATAAKGSAHLKVIGMSEKEIAEFIKLHYPEAFG